MSDTIIRVENLSKKYIIGHQKQERYTALRDVIANKAKSVGRRVLKPVGKKIANPTKEEFWALNDVSFEIKQGDRVGIIGRNGAGKSTLLKILSRITEPTKGRISINGRVASLLEVGTGFHPELTGRENIYLNGAILGMSKLEIKRKFDEIVAFAEVEKFLDTPVKRYSSGMYVRLAFAVAAHLEPEILVVDEVLAVGDSQFQKKCLGKMEDIGKEGRTVLFVSHNMGTIIQLCTRAVYLVKGQVADIGNVNSVVSKYLMSGVANSACVNLLQENNNTQDKPIFFKEIAIFNQENQKTSELDIRNEFHVRLTYEVISPLQNVEISLRVETDEGRPIFTADQSDYKPDVLNIRNSGTHQVSIRFPSMFLLPGSYLITIAAHKPMLEMYDIYEKILSFTINETGTKLAKYKKYHDVGVVVVELPWLEHVKLNS